MARLAAQGGNRNLDINPSTVFQYFVSRSKKNLHLVICLSPIGKKFRRLMQMYPSLLGCCSVDWYEGWPKNAMECVGEAYLINIDCEENMKTSIINVATEIHFKANDLASVLQEDYGRTTYITSSIFLKFMELYKCTYLDKLVGLSTSRARYVNGLSKLASAENQVFSMQHDLAVLQPQLEAAMEEAKVMLENVEKERITVDKASYQVKEDEKVANIQAEAAIALKTECENDLALAIPILEDAIEALNTLKPTDITLVKSMKNPPDNVKLVMAAVCVMKDVKPDRVPDPTNPGRKIMDFWGPSKRILGDMAFLQTLKDYDKDNIPPHIMQMIRKVYIPNKDFRPHVVAKASSAAEGLCKWVLAMDKYDTVVKMVAPKKKKLATAEEEYGRTVGLLEEKRAELILLQSKLKDLNTTLSAAVSQKQKIEKEVDLCAQKLRKAETIIDSLSSEKERWTGQVTSLAQALQTIVGDILISTASVAYLGPFPKRLREWSILNWIELSKATEIPVSDCFDLTSVLVDKIERENWILSGLPEDNFSIESGVILQFSKRWPLCIDPQGQANKWIRALVTLKKGYISRASDENCLNYLQDAIENGFQFLIENVQDHSDLASDPLLDLLTHYIDISESFIINGKLVHFHPEFRLYMTTGIQNPNYLPQTYHNIALIDFTLGEKGLIEQLVTTVVEIERKEISLDHNTLLQKRASNRRELKEAEDAILELLSTESNIIGDHASVIKLKSCKAISKSAQEKEIESEKLQQEVDSARQLYIPLANFSSCLFAAISCLQNINPFYQYSMKWFLAKYVKSIKITKHDEIDLEKRICSLKRDLTLSVHKNIIVSVLNKHKLLVSFLVCTSLLRFEGNLTDDEWSLLCATVKRGHLSLSSIIQGYSGSEDEIYLLEELEPFKGLRQHFQENIDEWNEALMDITSPSIPSPFYERLTNFQKLILFKILRPDKAMSMVKKLVFDTFNTSLVEYQGLDLHDVYKDSSNSTPILFLMMPGSDPLPIIFDLSEKLGLSDRLKFLALGKNQESKIEAIIRDGQKDGHWVCIHNCNVVATHWLENISVLMQEYEPSANLNFRLFLTSSPDEKKLPFAMLKDCFKIALERTEALKRSLWECYTMGLVGSNKFYNCCGKRQNTFAKLLFGISFFHAVVKAREKFGSLGWNLPYNFDEQDYFITIKNLQYLIKTTGSIPLEAIHYLIGYCTYGGKVTNIWDQRILHTLSAKYINFDVLSTMGYCLCGSDEKYVMPIGYSQTDYITFINNLPELTNPEVLGFHPNSTLVHDIKGGADFFQAMSGFVLGDLKFQVADKKPEVEIIDSILNKVRPLHGLIMENEVEKDSLGLFHQKECRCYKALLEIIETTLSNLRKSCLGTNYITSDQEIVIEYLINNTVPTVWSNASYSSTKSLSAFIENLIDRITNLAEWINSRKKNQYQISAFFNPQAFFTAKMNEYSLQEQMDFHDVCLDHSVLSLPTSNEHFQINGLYLESCHWNSDRHMIEEGHGITRQEEVPSLNVRMVRKDEVNLHDKYLCPIYSTALRDRHCDSTSRYSESIAQIYLNCKKPQEQWILKGVKLLAEVDSP